MSAWTKAGQVVAGAALAFTMSVATPQPAKADLYQVGFLLDNSGSIGTTNWTTIKNALAASLPLFIAANVTDTYELSVMSFSSTTQTIVTPTVITAGNIGTLQTTIQGAAFAGNLTNYNAAFTDMTNLMNPGSSNAAKSYINFATDGDPTTGGSGGTSDAQAGINARNYALAQGIDNISIEGIGGNVSAGYLTGSICAPQACDTTQPFNFPTQGFYIAVANAAQYESAVQTKIRTITNDVPEPASMILLGSGLAGLGLLARRRRRG